MKNAIGTINCASTKLQIKLGKIVSESVQPLTVELRCHLALRALITEGANRMELEGRTADEDVALACANLKHFIHEMKVESVFLGHAERLTYDSFRAAHRQIDNHAILTSFTLSPFWPSEYVVGNERRS